MLRSGNGLNALLLLAVVICALSVVTSQHKARKLYIELQQEKEHAQQMDVEWAVDEQSLTTSARIEKDRSETVADEYARERAGPNCPDRATGITLFPAPWCVLSTCQRRKCSEGGDRQLSPQFFSACGKGSDRPIL